jgi:hypothetical protein
MRRFGCRRTRPTVNMKATSPRSFGRFGNDVISGIKTNPMSGSRYAPRSKIKIRNSQKKQWKRTWMAIICNATDQRHDEDAREEE